MAFDYGKLRGRIVEIFGSQGKFAEAMEWSERRLSMKLTGKWPWKQNDICKAIQLLGLGEEEIPAYFFKLKVQED